MEMAAEALERVNLPDDQHYTFNKPKNSVLVKDNFRYQSDVFQDLSGTRIIVSDTLTGAKCSKQAAVTTHKNVRCHLS
jgi:hypothetical protein